MWVDSNYWVQLMQKEIIDIPVIKQVTHEITACTLEAKQTPAI